MLGYTGAPMMLSGFFHPLIVDLAGVRRPERFPIYRNHDSLKIVGHGSAEITDAGIVANGVRRASARESRKCSS
jgi:hypothetical protein